MSTVQFFGLWLLAGAIIARITAHFWKLPPKQRGGMAGYHPHMTERDLRRMCLFLTWLFWPLALLCALVGLIIWLVLPDFFEWD